MNKNTFKLLIKLNRVSSWILLTIATLIVAVGYSMTRLRIDRSRIMPIHTNLVYAYVALLTFHVIVSVLILKYPWRLTINQLREGKFGSWTLLRFAQRVSAWFILILSLIQIISGLGWYTFPLYRIAPFQPHVIFDALLVIGLVVHIIVGLKSVLARHNVTGKITNLFILSLMMVLITTTVYGDRYIRAKQNNETITEQKPGPVLEPSQDSESNLEHEPKIDENLKYPIPENTKPTRVGRITIDSQTIEFNPDEVKTTRPDIFKEGYFSMFDVLVHVAKQGLVELEYHFEESMNTHVIDSLEGEQNWWYIAYYDGGWSENNFFRPDHYPWKDGTTLKFFKVKPTKLNQTYSIFKEEMARLSVNEGKVIIPKVIISGRSFEKEFQDVEVTSHNLRNDVFQNDTITAIDVILSLGDQNKIDYKLQWYESIGTARIVKNYWVEEIDGDTSRGRCGFVYESGDQEVVGFAGNHIHLPSDTRVLNSPEYVWYFWICI